jgi:CHAT domain-containing protein
VRGPGDDPQAYARVLEATRAERDACERALAARSEAFRRDLAHERIGFAEVRTRLPDRSALVAFTAYTAGDDPSAKTDGGAFGKPRWARGTPHLLAFVLGPAGDLSAVPLGSMAAIDSLVARWSREARRGDRGAPAEAEARYFDAGAALRAAVWDRLLPHLGGARRVVVVPEGSLHKVSFAVLPTAPGRYLIDSDWRFQYLASERDLVPDTGAPAAGVGLLAVGGVDTSEPGTPQIAAAATSTTALAWVATRGPGFPCRGLENVRFPALLHTRGEVERIAATWAGAARDATRIQLLTGAEATETAFKKAVAGKRVIHVASHGFVLGLEDCMAPGPGTRSIVPAAPAGTGRLHPSQAWLSGLVFADVAPRAATAPPDDGVLTAQEAALLDLQGVEWVVLSACDTGLGRALNGEGVLGLRRAFQVAGAHTLVMSLWAVSDRETAAWMASLYEARLTRGRSTTDAVHEASLRSLEARRRRGASSHPFYWGAFVASGDWR